MNLINKLTNMYKQVTTQVYKHSGIQSVVFGNVLYFRQIDPMQLGVFVKTY